MPSRQFQNPQIIDELRSIFRGLDKRTVLLPTKDHTLMVSRTSTLSAKIAREIESKYSPKVVDCQVRPRGEPSSPGHGHLFSITMMGFYRSFWTCLGVTRSQKTPDTSVIKAFVAPV
jgi:hypothetical protein